MPARPIVRLFQLLLLTAIVSPASAAVFTLSGWAPTGSQASASAEDRAVLLRDGRVLAVKQWTRATELYQPLTGAWIAGPSLRIGRAGFSLTALPDGRALVAGGTDPVDGTVALSSCEVYDPVAGTWTLTGSMRVPRRAQIAGVLSNGRVLVAGGLTSTHPDDDTYTAKLSSAEIWNPLTGAWTTTTSMHLLRAWATGSTMRDGRVLVFGGYSGASGSLAATGEVYQAASATWTMTNEVPEGVVGGTLTTLNDGWVLLAGGANPFAPYDSKPTPQLLDPIALTWSSTGLMLVSREGHTATLLADGRVLVAGGDPPASGLPALASAELYHPTTGSWSAAPSMARARTDHFAVRLPDGRVLVGADASASGRCELYRRVTFTVPWWVRDRFGWLGGLLAPVASG